MNYKEWFTKIVIQHEISQKEYDKHFAILEKRFWSIPQQNDIYRSLLQERILHWDQNRLPFVYMSLWDIAYKEKNYTLAMKMYDLYNHILEEHHNHDAKEYEDVAWKPYNMSYEPTTYYIKQIEKIKKRM